MYMIDEHVACAVAGITADANILINQARLHAQRYRFSYQEPQPVEQLVQTLCDEKQAYTQFGGLRPFGVSMLYGGWDKTYGFQLYQSDPSGNYNGWKATCIGASNQARGPRAARPARSTGRRRVEGRQPPPPLFPSLPLRSTPRLARRGRDLPPR